MNIIQEITLWVVLSCVVSIAALMIWHIATSKKASARSERDWDNMTKVAIWGRSSLGPGNENAISVLDKMVCNTREKYPSNGEGQQTSDGLCMGITNGFVKTRCRPRNRLKCYPRKRLKFCPRNRLKCRG